MCSQLLARPTKLALVANERYGETTRIVTDVPPAVIVDSVEHMASIVASMAADWTAAPIKEPPPQENAQV